MNNAYREVFVVPPPPHRGPRTKCPVCGAERYARDQDNRDPWLPALAAARACTGTPWWRRLFLGGCRRADLHLHQTCRCCGARWICEPMELGVMSE